MADKRKIGKSGLTVNPVGLGCMGFSHAYGAPTEKNEAISMIRKAYEMGYDFFDTAECYIGTNTDGTTSYNEELVGVALRDVRNHVVIATKFGVAHGSNGLIMDSRPETIRKSVEGSLKRLGVDVIDLYYQHRIDPNIEPETVAEVMNELIKEGKIRYWGISETTEDYLRRADKACPVSAVQNRYSMLARDHEKLFPVLEELDVALVAFSPLGNGFLTGKYNASSKFEAGVDYRSHMPQYTEEGFKAAESLMKRLDELATEKGVTKGQISLAWMICKKPYIIPIPGSRKEERLRENIGSTEVSLSEAELAEIDELLDNLEMPVYGQKK